MIRRWLRLLVSLAGVAAAVPVTCAQNGAGVDLSGGGTLRTAPGGRINPAEPLLTQGH